MGLIENIMDGVYLIPARISNRRKLSRYHKSLIHLYRTGGYACCYHFSWDPKKEIAKNLLLREGVEYYCPCCGDKKKQKAFDQVDLLVNYLNGGGREDRVLRKITKDMNGSSWNNWNNPHILEYSTVKCNLSSEGLNKYWGFQKCPDMELE